MRASIRTIFSINRFDHSITDSHQLISNWFPQKKRSLLHLLSLAHKAIYYTSPPYLTSLLTLRRPLTSLRSNADISLICPRVSYLKYHKRAFSYMVPFLWNSLPASIRSINSQCEFHTRPLLHTSKLIYHRCNIFTYLIIQYYYFYKLYYFIVLFIYLSIYCFRSILLYAPTRGGHTYDKC